VLDDWSGGCGEAASEHQPVQRWSRGERVFLFLMKPERDSRTSAGGLLFFTATVSGRYTIERSGRLASESFASEVDVPRSASIPAKYTETELEEAVAHLPIGHS
jgi:hypothetical protein